MLRGVIDGLIHFDAMGFARAGTIVVGLAITVAGYMAGTIAQRLSRHKVIENEYVPEPLAV